MTDASEAATALTPIETAPTALHPRRPLATAGACAAAALILASSVAFAYPTLFGTFNYYDDEGFLMLSAKHFLDGHALYDEIPCVYGPLYFLYKLVAHSILGIPLSNDGVRFLALAFWALTAGLAALVSRRLTGRASLAVLVYAATFFHLAPLAHGPGHPQELCGLLLILCALVPLLACPGRPGLAAVGLGALAAGLALTKINIGAFVGVSLSLALLSAPRAGRMAGLARMAALAAAVALPFALMRADLAKPWALSFAIVIAVSTVSLAVVAWTSAGEASGPPSGALALFLVFLASWAAAAVLVFAVLSLRGTTLPALLDGMILAPSRLFAGFGWPARTRLVAIPWAVLGFGLAVLHARRVRLGRSATSYDAALAVLKATYAVAIFACALRFDPAYLINFGTPFLWLILTPVPVGETALPRRVLAFVAALQPLQAYPVPGGQYYFGTFLMIPIAATCLGDALRWAEPALARWPIALTARRTALPTIVLLVVALGATKAQRAWATYRTLVALDMPGAARVRVPAEEAATIRWLVSNLRTYSDTFLCTTGFNSLYFWTGKEPAGLLVVGSALDPRNVEAQVSLRDSLAKHPDAFAVEHTSFFAGLTRSDAPPPAGPLITYIQEAFVPCGRAGGFDLLARRGRPAPRLLDCARWDDDSGPGRSARLSLAPRSDREAARLIVHDLARRLVLSDSKPGGPGSAMSVSVEGSGPRPPRPGGPVTDLLTIDLSEPRDLALTFSPPLAPGRAEMLAVELLDERGHPIEWIPFLERDRAGSPAPADDRAEAHRGH